MIGKSEVNILNFKFLSPDEGEKKVKNCFSKADDTCGSSFQSATRGILCWTCSGFLVIYCLLIHWLSQADCHSQQPRSFTSPPRPGLLYLYCCSILFCKFRTIHQLDGKDSLLLGDFIIGKTPIRTYLFPWDQPNWLKKYCIVCIFSFQKISKSKLDSFGTVWSSQ